MNIQEAVTTLEDLGYSVRQSGEHWYFKCPVHQGSDNDSASITSSGNGKILFTCHSKGCSYLDFIKAIGVSPIAGVELRSPVSPEEVYQYTDENRNVLYEVLRYQGKKFKQRCLVNGESSWSIKDVRRVPYRLPEVLEAIADGRTVFWVEGEKDVHTLERLGLCATTSSGGAGGKFRPEWVQLLAGINAIVIPDNDKPGDDYAENVCTGLAAAGKARVVRLPGLCVGGDVSDWIGTTKTATDLLAVISRPLVVIEDFMNIMELDLPEPQYIISPWMTDRSLGMLYAKRGIGKTQVCLTLAVGVSCGTNVFGWDVTKKSVVYVDGEMDLWTLRERIAKIHIGLNVVPCGNLYVISRDRMMDMGLRFRYLSDTATREALLDAIPTDAGLVILDNLSSIWGGEENDAAAWDEHQAFLSEFRSRHTACMMVHHAGKSGDQRGTSRREDILDYSIRLEQPEEDSQKFIWQWKKIRGWDPAVTPPFIAQVVVSDDSITWSIESHADAKMSSILSARDSLLVDGEKPTVRQISEITGIPRSTVYDMLKKASDDGYLSE